MPTISDNAICIRHWDFSETSQTVSLLGREYGILRGLAKGSKREKGSFSGGIDVLTRGQVLAIVKPGRDLATLTEWHLLEVYPTLRRRLEANRAGLYAADLVHHLLREHDPHPEVFDALTAMLDALGLDGDPQWPLLRFQWQVLCETGFRPRLSRDARTGADLPADAATLGFSAAAGGVVSDAGDDGWRVRRQTIDLLRAVAEDQAIDAGQPEVAGRANRLLAAYIRDLIGQEPATMRWAFDELQR